MKPCRKHLGSGNFPSLVSYLQLTCYKDATFILKGCLKIL